MRNIVCISGTSRPGNYTSHALAVVVNELDSLGEKTTVFDARELDLAFPGYPQTGDAERLVAAVKNASGIVLASPEYHGGVCAMTKLIIENLGFPSSLAGKPVATLGVAAGRIGAIKSLEQLKGICSHTGAIVVPGSVSIAGVRQVFDEQGICRDEGAEIALRGLARSVHDFLDDFVCPRYVLESMVRDDAKPWATTV
ncbi:MAG: NADPH-dependent oxidoreductase [Xanthomonadales bacterium]|nr:NAD(P)H-dependent oxidoreductase [Xanthomonadales bacterium]NIX13032.1 NADPH-dependent oxidoreductase [Xanthomonadales bacterium]